MIREVSVDDMDGFEFQYFVARLFEELGLGKILEIRKVRDVGRDITLMSPDGELIIVECKHHPRGTIGRPVVQKLHSALITYGAKEGYIVTTGEFSPDAVEYAKKLGSLIKLVDFGVLCDMASRAQIRIVKKGESPPIYYVIPPSGEVLEKQVISRILHEAVSYPYAPSKLSQVNVVDAYMIPAYLLEYSLHEDFKTGTGRLIHSLHFDRELILIDGRDGKPLPPQYLNVISPSSLTEDYGIISLASWFYNVESLMKYGFNITRSMAKSIGIRYIISRHTQVVRYRAKKTRRRYVKKCRPHRSNIIIQRLMQVYIPYLTVSLKILGREHYISISGNQNEIVVLDGEIKNCEICGKPFKGERLICNTCGRIVHTPSFRGHSYICEECGKTICKKCAYWTRKHLFFKRKLCENCAQNLAKKGERIRKFTP